MPVPRRRRRAALLIGGCLAVLSCTAPDQTQMSAAQRDLIANALKSLIVSAYDLSKPDPVARLMSLYPPRGDVVSASGGHVSTSRDSLEAGIRAFWNNVGKNMRDPKWTWGAMHVEVLSPNAAVVTTTYSVAHHTPRGEPHVIAGAWTAVFKRVGTNWMIVQEHLSDAPTAAALETPK